MTVAGSSRPIMSTAAVLFYLLGSSIIFNTTTSVSAFLVPPTHIVGISFHRAYRKPPWFRSRKLTNIHLSDPKAPPPLPDTSDPYILLGLTTPTADQRQIKRAYKRMALQYHPDVRLTPNSTQEDKKAANDNFARINAAYAFLSGKSTANGKPGTAPPSQKAGASRRKTSSAYDPPHRRTGAPKDTSFSTNWEDYMPKYDENYDTDGDSFSAIFNDFVAGSVSSSSSSSSSSSGGILSDFISFLEGNFGSSFGATEKGEDDSIEFTELLNNGSIEAIKNEMDDANLLTKQLEQKDLALTKEYDEILSQDSGSGGGRSYLEEMRLEERKGEIEARQKVVRNYLNKANARRIKLRKRYEDLRSSRDTSRSSRTTSDSVGDGASSSSSENDQKNDSSWKRESFGSNGRRRRRGSGAGRSTSSSPYSSSSSEAYSSRSSRTSSTTESESIWTETRKRSSTGRTASSTNTSQSNSSTSRTNKNDGNIPPHRRLTAPYLSPDAEKKRLREIKVEEKIDEMKRELGL